MSKEMTTACMAGLLSGGLFLAVFGLGLGFLFMFLPTLPLFFTGLSKNARLTPVAVGIASVIVGTIIGPASALMFLMFIGLPTLYMSKESLLSKTGEWFPVGLIIMHLAFYACTIVAIVTLYYTTEPGGLPHLLSQNIHQTFADLEDEYGEVIGILAGAWSFLMFPVTIWLWAIMLYAHAWLANRLLVKNKAQIRPDYAVVPFAMPSWMLSLLAICALASLIGSESMSFLGKSTMISLLLPYFFLGAAVMHTTSSTWPSNRFFLFFVYFMVITQFWPALILAGIGLWQQIKHLSQGTSSFRN